MDSDNFGQFLDKADKGSFLTIKRPAGGVPVGRGCGYVV